MLYSTELYSTYSTIQPVGGYLDLSTFHLKILQESIRAQMFPFHCSGQTLISGVFFWDLLNIDKVKLYRFQMSIFL
jgi:hypothetical protein